MRRFKPILASGVLLCLGACGADTSDSVVETAAVKDVAVETAEQAATTTTPAETLAELGVNAGTYQLDEGHAFLTWTVSHNGLSKYTARFTDFDAAIELDTDNPAASRLTASVNPLSVRTDHPSGPDWDTTLATDAKWFNAEAFPEITYTSTAITGLNGMSGKIEGELSLLGVSYPVDLDMTLNGVRNFPWYGERDVIGFSASATLKRSDFGMLALLPDIGDEVAIELEVEFVQAE